MDRHDELRLGLVLAVDHVHLKLLLGLLKQISELYRIFDALLEIFGEITAI